MLLRLKKYSLNVAYKKEKEIYLANTRPELSLQIITCPRTCQRNWRKSIREHSSMSVMDYCNRSNMRQPMTSATYAVQRCAGDDHGENQKFQNSSTPTLVSPCIRMELIAIVRISHIEIEASIRGARYSLFCPRMLTEIKEYISKWDICLGHPCAQAKEPLLYNTKSWHDSNSMLELICANLSTAPSKSSVTSIVISSKFPISMASRSDIVT